MRTVNDVEAPELFRENMCNLRSGEYYGIIEEIQRELMTEKVKQKLELSNMLDNAYIEALFIYATRKQYEETIKADVVLMALGLLKTMYHHDICNTKSKKEAITQCRVEFLKKSTYVEEDYKSTKYSIESYEDAEKQGITKVLIDALKAAEERYINKVTDKLYANYVDYLSDILNNREKFIETLNGKTVPLLPELKNRRKNVPNVPGSSDLSPDNPIPQRDINAIGYYIKAIQTSTDYDEHGDKLYEALCGQGKSPYSEWVATWLIKCIRERFGESMDAYILYASFALFEEYELGMTDINMRLSKYYNDGGYSDKSHSFVEFINRKNQKKKLKEYEQALTNNLIKYIVEIPTPQDHIVSLNGFGKKIIMPNGKIYYKPIRPYIKFTDRSRPSPGLKLSICTVITVMVMAATVFLVDKSNRTTINNNTINNPPDRESYISKGDLPMVESLQITKDTIYIKAGKRSLLDIDVKPPDALKLLQYYSSNGKLVVVSDNGVIQAATNWAEDTVPEVKIYIHAKNIIKEIRVIVYK